MALKDQALKHLTDLTGTENSLDDQKVKPVLEMMEKYGIEVAELAFSWGWHMRKEGKDYEEEKLKHLALLKPSK